MTNFHTPYRRKFARAARSVPAACMILAFLSVGTRLAAQTPDLTFRPLEVEATNAFRPNTFSGFALDEIGSLLIGTPLGWHHYDGVSITALSWEQSPGPVLCVARDGTRWFGAGLGLFRVDPLTNAVTQYNHVEQDENSLLDDHILSLCEDGDGNIWIGMMDGGLSRLDPETEQFTHFVNDPNDPDSLSSGAVLSMAVDDAGRIWICVGASRGLGGFMGPNEEPPALDVLDTRSLEFAHLAGRLPAGVKEDPVRPWTVFEDSAGTIWIGTLRDGLFRYQDESGGFISVIRDPADKADIGRNWISDIIEDSSGTLWITTYDGLYTFDPETGGMAHHVPDPDDPSSGQLIAVIEDASGVIWVGGDFSGIYSYSPSMHQIPAYMSGYTVLDVFDTADGDLWVVHDRGVRRYANTWEYVDYVVGPSDSEGNPVFSAECGIEDVSGTVWVGTWGGGLFRLDRDRGRFLQVAHRPAGLPPGSSPEVYHLELAAGDGLWMATLNGLELLDTESLTSRVYEFDFQINDVFTDSRGEFWVALGYGGLVKLDTDSGEIVRQYLAYPADPTSISGRFVNYVHEDSSGVLWASVMNGLNRFDRATESFTLFNEESGFANMSIVMTFEDTNGYLWASTFGGISRFDLRTHEVRNFDVTSGTLPNYYLRSGTMTRDGRIIFGGEGFSMFTPQDFPPSDYSPRSTLTSFKVFNEEYPLDTIPAFADRIDLS